MLVSPQNKHEAKRIIHDIYVRTCGLFITRKPVINSRKLFFFVLALKYPNKYGSVTTPVAYYSPWLTAGFAPCLLRTRLVQMHRQ